MSSVAGDGAFGVAARVNAVALGRDGVVVDWYSAKGEGLARLVIVVDVAVVVIESSVGVVAEGLEAWLCC